jgi:hypothetical protein
LFSEIAAKFGTGPFRGKRGQYREQDTVLIPSFQFKFDFLTVLISGRDARHLLAVLRTVRFQVPRSCGAA